MATIEMMDQSRIENLTPHLISLLRDCVDEGASLGFLPPLTDEEARSYWKEISSSVAGQQRILLAAFEGNGLAGTVQLALEPRPNGSHRAEVQRLMVFPRFRGCGLGKALMNAIEGEALKAGRTLLILNTRRGEAPEFLYRRLGYQEAGVIPGFTRTTDGKRHDTVLFFRTLNHEE